MKLLLFLALVTFTNGSLFFHQCYQGNIRESGINETGGASLQNCYALENECTWRYTHSLNGSSVNKEVDYGCSSALWGHCQNELGGYRNRTISCTTYESTVNGTIINSMFCCCNRPGCNGEQIEKYQIVEDFLDMLPEPLFDDEDLTDSAMSNGFALILSSLMSVLLFH